MRILVTGARGKVGAATVAALHDAGHEVTASDRLTPNFERTPTVRYLQAELRDAGETFAAVRGHEVVIHAAAVPDPSQNTPHAVFHNNVMSTFNVIEAAVRFDVGRVVFLSSETVTGFTYAERPFLPDYVPIDEDLPARPQDPYALSKLFGEGLMDAAVRRSDVRCISVRPSGVCWEGDYEDRLGRYVRERDDPSVTEWSYIDVYDLTDALTLAAESSLPGHEVFYIASPDNVPGRPLAEAVRAQHGGAIAVRSTDRPDASGIACAKARRLLRYAPKRGWRDYLDEDGCLRAEMRARLARGETAVQRGRSLSA